MNRLDAIREELATSERLQCTAVALQLEVVRDLLAVAVAVAELPWTKRGLLIDIPEIAGLSGSCKDRRLRHLQKVLAPLLEEVTS